MFIPLTRFKNDDHSNGSNLILIDILISDLSFFILFKLILTRLCYCEIRYLAVSLFNQDEIF